MESHRHRALPIPPDAQSKTGVHGVVRPSGRANSAAVRRCCGVDSYTYSEQSESGRGSHPSGALVAPLDLSTGLEAATGELGRFEAWNQIAPRPAGLPDCRSLAWFGVRAGSPT